MQTVQLAIADKPYAERLCEALRQDWAFRGWQVRCVPAPDPRKEGLLVLDQDALGRLKPPLAHPERVVLVTHRDATQLSQAWNAGIVSVIHQEDPLGTAMLAILAARYRAPASALRCSQGKEDHGGGRPRGASCRAGNRSRFSPSAG